MLVSRMARGKVVLAYSGGLDTSVAIRWINEKYDLDVIAVTVDVGNEKDFEVVRQKALRTGAIQAFISDAKESFVRDFAIPSLQAGTLYQNVYPLAMAYLTANPPDSLNGLFYIARAVSLAPRRCGHRGAVLSSPPEPRQSFCRPGNPPAP